MIPKAARPILGRAEFTKGLGVTNKALAIDLSHAVLADWKAAISAALAPPPPPYARTMDADALADIAVEVGYDRATSRVLGLVERKAKEGAVAFADLKAKFDQRADESVRQRRAGDQSYWIERARKLVVDRGLSITDNDREFLALVDALAICGGDTFAYAKAFMEGSEHHFLPSPLVRAASDRKASRAVAGEGVSELYERYAAQRLAEGRQRPDTVNQGRKVIALFTEFVGLNRSLSSIQPADVREWRNAIASLPPAFRKRKENEGLLIRDASKRAAAQGLKGITSNTVNKYLSTVSPLFDWARQEGYVDRNPCDGLFYDLQKAKKSGKGRRPPFDQQQINNIMLSPLFTGFMKDGKEWKPGDCRADDWRFWIPLVCLFTGARIGEIAQLRIDDVREEDGIHYLWIKDDEVTGQTTKSGHCRPAVIHSKLQSIGFLAFVGRQRTRAAKDLDGRLFPDLKPDARGQIGTMPSRFWRTYLTRIGIKSGRDGYGSHSFRHGLADQLRIAGYLDDEIEVALGHNQVSVTAGYGQLRQGTVKRIAAMIESMKFDGMDFSHLEQHRRA